MISVAFFKSRDVKLSVGGTVTQDGYFKKQNRSS